jgi:hypothetical protein
MLSFGLSKRLPDARRNSAWPAIYRPWHLASLNLFQRAMIRRTLTQLGESALDWFASETHSPTHPAPCAFQLPRLKRRALFSKCQPEWGQQMYGICPGSLRRRDKEKFGYH